MSLSTTTMTDDPGRTAGLSRGFNTGTATLSAVSWGAIAAGAAGAAALSLILLILGVGLGLSSVSPWARDGVSAATLGVSTIVWVTLTQLLASALGGYLAGRLRSKWTEVHTDEVYFRDTAHGFLAWAVSSLATAALLTSVIGSIVGGGVQAGAAAVGGVASTGAAAVAGVAGSAVTAATGTDSQDSKDSDSGAMGYFVDSLFRRAPNAPAPTATASTSTAPIDNGQAGSSAQDAAEVGRILINAGRSAPLPPEDLAHVAQIVAQRTGLSQQDSEKRVADTVARAQKQWRDAELAAREAADTARKATAYSSLWLFVSLLGGAFVASLAATFGGRSRDASSTSINTTTTIN